VARTSESFHRNGTELELGPSGVKGWLAATTERFGFIRRCSWPAALISQPASEDFVTAIFCP
jgi:hypothetical protein